MRHGATQSCTRTRRRETPKLSRLRNLQLEAHTADLNEHFATRCSNLKVNAQTVADETAVRNEQEARNAQNMSETVDGVEALRNAIQIPVGM